MVVLKIPDKSRLSWYRKTRQSLILKEANMVGFSRDSGQRYGILIKPKKRKDLSVENLLLRCLHI
jgi:hypothetical protein